MSYVRTARSVEGAGTLREDVPMLRRLSAIGTVLLFSACGSSTEPLSAEMESALGSYALVSVNGVTQFPVAIGNFSTATGPGASVTVTGGGVVLTAKEMTATVSMTTRAVDPIQGVFTSNPEVAAGGQWTLIGGNLSLVGSTGMGVSSATVSGDALTMTALSSAFASQGSLRLVFRRSP
jgi:hypothetical protein